MQYDATIERVTQIGNTDTPVTGSMTSVLTLLPLCHVLQRGEQMVPNGLYVTTD
jgi:hypothetical protein